MTRRAAVAAAAAAIVAATTAAANGAAAARCPAPQPMTFGPQSYVDTTRAGGEPMIHVHPNGTLLYAAHAGTTHVFVPAGADADSLAFAQSYEGQTYVWNSYDNGATWEFIPRKAPSNDPAQGFSDPDFAIDTAGQVYISEINLANVAMSKSTDAGKTYALQNFFAQTVTDRQWSEADQKDVLYLVGNAFGGGTSTNPIGNLGHYLYRSTDGGKTYTPGQEDGDGLGDLRVDKRNGTLYEAYYGDNVLSIAAFRKARSGNLTPEIHTIAKDVRMLSHWPTIDVDDAGNVYIVWDEGSGGKRPPGVYYSYSTNGGRTWAKAVRVDRDVKTDTWPWLAVGSPGRVAIAWLEASRALPDSNTEATGDFTWRIMAAQTLTGLGCPGAGANASAPSFTVSTVTPEPVHVGQICASGTTCQAMGIDRRLGDYFAIEVDTTGAMVLAYSDTRRGGMVSLPGFSRQTGGPSFKAATFSAPKRPATKPGVLGNRRRAGSLASTGVAEPWYAFMGVALIASAALLRRYTRRHA